MINTVPAPGLSDQIRAAASGSVNVLPIAQPRPCAGSVQLGPMAVIRIIALVRASGKVRHPPGGNQQHADGRPAGRLTPFGQPVLTVGALHLAALTVRHALHDDADRRPEGLLGTPLMPRIVQRNAVADALWSSD